MKKVLLALALASGITIPAITRAQFASGVVSYTQGSGVTAGYNNSAAALGAPTTFIGYQNADPFNPPYQSSDIVGIGTGGSITLQFSTPIQNSGLNPYGRDFIIFGHAGFTEDFDTGTTDGSLFTGGTSDTRISVSSDGINFYTLDPSQTPIVDGLFPTDSSGNPFLPVNPALTASDFAGQDLAGIQALYGGSAGGASFDISWALDGSNQSVSLSSIDYVRLDVLSGVDYIDAVSIVPEPGTGTLVVIGAALLLWQWRKQGATRYSHHRAPEFLGNVGLGSPANSQPSSPESFGSAEQRRRKH